MGSRPPVDPGRFGAEDSRALIDQMPIGIRENEDRLRQLLETVKAIPWEVDATTWRHTYVGPQAVEILGCPFAYGAVETSRAWSKARSRGAGPASNRVGGSLTVRSMSR